MECPKSIIEVQVCEIAGFMPMTVASLEVTAQNNIFNIHTMISCDTKESEPVFRKLYLEVLWLHVLDRGKTGSLILNHKEL